MDHIGFTCSRPGWFRLHHLSKHYLCGRPSAKTITSSRDSQPRKAEYAHRGRGEHARRGGTKLGGPAPPLQERAALHPFCSPPPLSALAHRGQPLPGAWGPEVGSETSLTPFFGPKVPGSVGPQTFQSNGEVLRTMPMKSLALLVVLLLWPSSSQAYSSVTVIPDEEKSLNHYVQVLQNVLRNVPTKEDPSTQIKKMTPTNVYSTGLKVSKIKEIITNGETLSDDKTLSSPVSEEKTPFPSRVLTSQKRRKKRTKTTAFWSIKPNNISVVLRTKEPYIIKDEEEEEPEVYTRRTPSSKPFLHVTSKPFPHITFTSHVSTTISTENSDWSTSTESEDVPQLTGQFDTEKTSIFQRPPQTLNNENVLKKISEINAQIQQAHLSGHISQEFREDIQASIDHLKRSIALAAAAEHKLTKMYESESLPFGRTGSEIADVKTIINMLYNSRSKLSEYFDIKYVPSEMREKAITVFNMLKKRLCLRQKKAQRLIKKLLRNNMKILSILHTS
ncbi:PREDICTED: sperm equatorial segment protein 1 [Elephantulus edwardii]|uniref:sperm equatorial segment protein 1 n=1 Tax=Elephantulus edwardii TaxID=28737 RepID=UPI0003F0EDCD|nr:PREDICTED: sperm equatorial segment protein 1 [Elephantulus edwardii]